MVENHRKIIMNLKEGKLKLGNGGGNCTTGGSICHFRGKLKEEENRNEEFGFGGKLCQKEHNLEIFGKTGPFLPNTSKNGPFFGRN